MGTVVWAIFYLWLVLTILLAAMWFLHRHDKKREDRPEDDVLLPGFGGPLSEAAKLADAIRADEPTIEQLLEGIALPFGLAASEESIVDSGRHAVYLSAHPDAEQVGTAFADQLVDLGYAIEAAGSDRALATRNGHVLSMRIAANTGTEEDGDADRYAKAGDSDVAIEVWTGDGPAPSIKD